jgi:Beta-L-arabinofuranosidase, GH127
LSVRGTLRSALGTGFWRPSSAQALIATRPGRSRSGPSPTAEERLAAAAEWLRRAQDATGDGGVSWSYDLRRGWAPSYPETTGYIIPTMLALAARSGDDDFRRRAGKAVEFLARIQLPNGAFPAGTRGERSPRPSVFNTGQIINGLTNWYAATKDESILGLARAAADWLLEVQDEDGAWRRFGYLGYPVTYTAHASCWLAELGVVADEPSYREAALRHIGWVIAQCDRESGWFERSGFSEADHRAHRAVTHTYAYTVWGVLDVGVALGRPEFVAAARRSAVALAELTLAGGWLPGIVDASWSGRSNYACLTGNAQMALIWMRLAEIEQDPRFDLAARRVLELVGDAQAVRQRNPGIRGGIPGSDPIWGSYMPSTLPNWAAKFYIDALLTARRRDREPQP